MQIEHHDLEKKFIEVLHSEHIQFRETEPWLDATIVLHTLNNECIYVYGAGKDVDVFVKYLKDLGANVCGIIDRDVSKQKVICEGVEIISPDRFRTIEKRDIFVFIYAFVMQGSSDEKEIIRLLNQEEVNDYCFVGDSRYSVLGILPQHAGMNEGRRSYYKLHESELLEIYRGLADEFSKKTMTEYIRAYIECSSFQLKELSSKWKYFFDEGQQTIYKHLDNEVWINCGADEGGTIARYFRNGLKAKKIYAVDGDILCAKKFEDNLKYYPKEIKNRIEFILHYIDGKGDLENIIRHNKKEERITLINADIEGSELTLLKELKNTIKQDRPVIALCVYHKKEDLIDIPKYISSIVEGYYFFLRKYATWLRGDSRRCFELVLYAVPKERMR